MEEPHSTASPSHAPRPLSQGESFGSLVIGAAIFAYAGFLLTWAAVPAAQYAMWVLRVLAVAFVVVTALMFTVPRVGRILRVVVIALAAAGLCSAGAWMLVVTGGKDLFAWLLVLMGVFDAAEVWRYLAARRAMGG